MPRLRTVETWPSTRHADVPWHTDADLAAFLAASRGVFDLYSDELPHAEQSSKASSIRFFPEEVKSAAGFRVGVVERWYEGFEMVHVAVPDGFGQLGAAERARAALSVIDATTRTLGELRGWDMDRLAEVGERVKARGLRYSWASGWKANPGRRHDARAVYWLDDEGHGRVQLEIRRHDHETVISRGSPVLSFMTAPSFRRSAKTLHWSGPDSVTVVPWIGLIGDAGASIQLHATDSLAPLAVPEPVPAAHEATAVTTVLVSEEPDDDPGQPWLLLEVIDARGSGSYGSEIQRACQLLAKDAAFTDWWAQTPFRILRVRISTADPRWSGGAPKPGARKSGTDLVLQVVTDLTDLPPRTDLPALKGRAHEDLHGALTRMAISRKFPPPPPLPARVGVNSREWRAQAKP